MSADDTTRRVPTPPWLGAAVPALLGLSAAALTAVAIGAHRVGMAVLLVLAVVALLVIVARQRYAGTSPRPVSEPRALVETIAKRPRPKPSLKRTRPAAAPAVAPSAASQPATAAPSPTVPVSSVAEEIAKLGQLKDAGLITDDEFAAQKAKLLNL